MSETVYHFIGLGGIGMSALARLLLQKGSRVKGSDVAQTALLEKLQMEGADGRAGGLRQLNRAHLGLVDGAARPVGGKNRCTAGLDDALEALANVRRFTPSELSQGDEATAPPPTPQRVSFVTTDFQM